MTENMSTAAARRALEAEKKYSREIRALRENKENELRELDERHKLLKSTHRMDIIRIKEDYALRRLNLKTQIEHLRDQRANLRHALSIDADTTGLGDLEDFTTRINNLHVELIGLQRREHVSLQDADSRFEQRDKELVEERRAINKHYINEADALHEQYLAIVEQNRQLRIQEEGGVAV